MAIAYNQTMIKDQLVLHLDAANPKSYSGGSNWKDLTKNFSDSVLSGGYSFTADYKGGIVFNGFDSMIGPESFIPYDLDDNTTPRTWEVWIKTNSTSNQGIFGHKTSSGCSYFCNGGLMIYGGSYCFNWYDNSAYRFLDAITPVSNNPVHIVATFESDAIPRLYINGNLEAEYTEATFLDYSGGMNGFDIGYNSKNGGQDYFDGSIHIVKSYIGKALTPEEIKRNFEAQRKRFGI